MDPHNRKMFKTILKKQERMLLRDKVNILELWQGILCILLNQKSLYYDPATCPRFSKRPFAYWLRNYPVGSDSLLAEFIEAVVHKFVRNV